MKFEVLVNIFGGVSIRGVNKRDIDSIAMTTLRMKMAKAIRIAREETHNRIQLSHQDED